MFDLLGWGEILLILLLSFVIVGPKDLPKLFYALGRWAHRLKAVFARFQDEWEGLVRMEQLKELEKEMVEAKKQSEQASKEPQGKDS
jgi:sec-independent protein translocase protein TatB